MPYDDELIKEMNNFKNKYKNITIEENIDLFNSILANYNKITDHPQMKNDEDKKMEIRGLIYFIIKLNTINVEINQVISIFNYLYNMRFDEEQFPHHVNFFWNMIGQYLLAQEESFKTNGIGIQLDNLIKLIINYIPKFEEIFANSNNDVLYRILKDPNIDTGLHCDFILGLQHSRLVNYYDNCSYVQYQLAMISINGRIISNTSGDFHNKSRSPLFFKINNKEYVYKYRLFQTEKVIDEIFYIYGVHKEKHDLSPIPKIYGTSSFAYMEKVIYEGNMNQNEALDYLYKIGEMCYIVLLTGMSDLHKENIIATKMGPMIIDGECVFDIYELNKEINIYNTDCCTCIDKIIECTTKKGSGNKTNTMEIKVDNTNIKLYEKGTDNKNKLTIYGKELVNGFNEAITKMTNNHLINCIYKNVKKNLTSRYIPISTDYLSTIFNYYESGINLCANKILIKINDLIDKIVKIDKMDKIFYCHKDVIYVKLKEIYERGDIPIFYFEYSYNGLKILLEDLILVFLHDNQKNIARRIIELIKKREMDLRDPAKFNIEDLIKQL